MKWQKSPDVLVQAFDHSLPIVEGVQRRPMFGYPCAFFNGHLFCGLHQDSIIVLLSDAHRDALVAQGARIFEPMPGRPMSAYVVVPPEIATDRQRLRALLSDALAHASSLAPKAKKKADVAGKKAMPSKREAPLGKKALAKKASAKKVAAKKVPAKKASAKTGPAKKARSRKAAPAKASTKKTKAARNASAGKRRSR